jgi:hypothetical protein
MSRANTPSIRPGDARSAASVNAVYAAIEAAANNLNEVNLAEEGITRYVTAARQKADNVVNIELNTRTARPVAAWGTLVNAATTFRSGALALAANEVYRVRASIEHTSTVGAGVGIPAGAQVGIRIAYSVAGVVTVVTSSTRRRTVAVGALRGLDGKSLLAQCLLFGPVNFDWIEAQDLVVGAGCYIDKTKLDVTIFRRVT